jgi:hypothetical protein
MYLHWKRLLGIQLIALLLVPLSVFSQDMRRGDYGYLQVTNDWENTVRVTLWNEQGGQLSRRTWTIPQGRSALLAEEDGGSLRVGGNDKIKVGDDWGRVDIGTVGRLQGRTWHVNVRDVWQATHQGRGRPGQPGLPPDPPGAPHSPYRR